MRRIVCLAVLVVFPLGISVASAAERFEGTALGARLSAADQTQQRRLEDLRQQLNQQQQLVDEATILSTWASGSPNGAPSTLFTNGDELWVNTSFKASGGTVFGIGVVYGIGVGIILPPIFGSNSFNSGQTAIFATGWKLTSVPYCTQAVGIHLLVDGGAPQFSVTAPFTVCP